MNADKAPEPAILKPRRIAPELWAGAIIVAVCLGAYFGPRLYRTAVAVRTARALRAVGDTPDEAVGLVAELLRMDLPLADTLLEQYAAASPLRAWVRRDAWMAKTRVFAGVYRGSPAQLVFIRATVPPRPVLVLDQCAVPEGVSIEKLEWTGAHLQIIFTVSDKVAAESGTPPGHPWKLPLSAEQIVSLYDRHWSLFDGCYRGVDGGRGFIGGDSNNCYSKAEMAAEWLRMAGALPARAQAQTGE
jgi:hypothetical protein